MSSRLIGGARPTGGLHVGHLKGMIQPFLDYLPDMDLGVFVVADLHMFTTHAQRQATDLLPGRVRRLMGECLAIGFPTDRVIFVRQSLVPEASQMFAIVQSLVTWEPLVNQASYVEMSRGRTGCSLGLLGYPVLEAADAVAYGITDMAVGEHNVAHAEVAQAIARRLREEWDVTDIPIPRTHSGGTNLIGLDGAVKMGKSLGNTVDVTATPAQIDAAVDAIPVDDRPDNVPLRFLESLNVSGVRGDWESGRVSTLELREQVRAHLHELCGPIRERWQEIHQDEALVDKLVAEGSATARDWAADRLRSVKDALSMAVL